MFLIYKDSDEEPEDDLLECIMCRNQMLVNLLKRHIKFHHMIQEEEIAGKIYNMHFSMNINTIETQTSVSWVKDMYNLDQRIEKIETNLENNDQREKSSGTLKLKIKTANALYKKW